MSAELMETLRSIGDLEADGESVPNQFEYVEPKKPAGEYITKVEFIWEPALSQEFTGFPTKNLNFYPHDDMRVKKR